MRRAERITKGRVEEQGQGRKRERMYRERETRTHEEEGGGNGENGEKEVPQGNSRLSRAIRNFRNFSLLSFPSLTVELLPLPSAVLPHRICLRLEPVGEKGGRKERVRSEGSVKKGDGRHRNGEEEREG